MDKIERVDATLAGSTVDRPAVSAWYHFGVQHAPGTRVAEISLEFFRQYDLDFLKLMNDYYYPFPPARDEISTAGDLRAMERFDVTDSPWAEQLAAIDVAAHELEGRAYFLDTMFDPWQWLRRGLAGEHLYHLMDTELAALKGALEVMTANLVDYAIASVDRGAAGIFLSVGATEELLTREQAEELVMPYAERIVEAVAERAPFTTLHAHGENVFVDLVTDTAAPVLSYQDRGANNPPLASMKEAFNGCVMCGVDQNAFKNHTPAHIRRCVRSALADGGRERFFLTPGCSIAADLNPLILRTFVEEAQAAASGE